MNIKLVKERDLEDIIKKTCWYCIHINDKYVDKTYTRDLDQAKQLFEALVASNGRHKFLETLEEVNIDD